MEPGSLLNTIKSDFAGIVGAGEFTEFASVTDGTTTISLGGFFDDGYQDIDPEAQGYATDGNGCFTVAEDSSTLPLRRKGLVFIIRGKTYKLRDWRFDGINGLSLFLDESEGALPSVAAPVNLDPYQTQTFTQVDEGTADRITLRYKPVAGDVEVFSRGEWLVADVHFRDNHDGTITILDLDWLPEPGDYISIRYRIF